MKIKYVWHSLISPHVNFHNDRSMLLVKKIQVGEKEKEPRKSI